MPLKRAPIGRVAVLAAVLLLALAPSLIRPSQAGTPAVRIAVESRPIAAFDPREPSRTRFGALTFRGGLVLTSPHRDFGGLSGLHVAADGEHFLAISDKGRWLRGRLLHRDGTLSGVADAEMAPMLGPDGQTLRRRGWYDTEALAAGGDGAFYVGIERVQRIVRFDGGGDVLRRRARPVAVPRPLAASLSSLPANQSLECLAVSPGGAGAGREAARGAPPAGTLIAIAERGLDADGNFQGFLIGKGGGTFTFRRSGGFDVSDCAVAPDGRLLVLERRFSWLAGFGLRIRSVPLAALAPGALVEGTELMTADMGHQIDNMEALSAHRDADGAVVITLVSDDNFLVLQRTLLLQFTLQD